MGYVQEASVVQKYNKRAAAVKQIAGAANMKSALTYGVFRAIILAFFLYTAYVATYFVQVGVVNPPTNKKYLIEEILAVNVAMIIAFTQILLIVPKVTQVVRAAKVGSTIFQVIERTPKI